MAKNRKGTHTVSRLTVHLVWVTKYRYKVLEGEIQKRCRTILRQDCDAKDIVILKGVVGKDHVHMHIEYPPKESISGMMKQFKGRSSRILQKEFGYLKRRYWGQRFWASGYGAWSTGNVTEEMVQKYIEQHKSNPNENGSNFLLE